MKAHRRPVSGCGSQRMLHALERRSHPADHGPSFASLFPPLAAVSSAAIPVRVKLKIPRANAAAATTLDIPTGWDLQQRRPRPVADAGRSCWGSGQQDARAAQGTMRMLGAATRKKRKPFQIVLLPNPHPICKLNLHLFCVLRKFLAILRQCKKLCGFCLTGSRLRAIMNT